MKLHRLLSALLVCSFVSHAFAADASRDARIARIERALLPPVIVKGEQPQTLKLSDRMRDLHVPAVSIAVIHRGEIDWARGYGVTRIGGAAVTTDTVFQAASISKPVTALAVLQLVQAGRLDLDADVNRYLTSWKVPAAEFSTKEKVTLRRLLTHTAGTSVSGFPGYEAGAALPTLTQILNGESPANTPPIRVVRTPGESWQYSGGGYTIVQQLLIDVSGMPFPTLLEERVLAPLGMTRSVFAQPAPAGLLERAALAYRTNDRPVANGPHVYPELAAAGLWTTPSDLARYAIGVQRSLEGKAPQILSQEMTRAMLTPGMNDWGLGPVTGGSTAKDFQHSGSNEGYRCLLVAYQDGDGAVVMLNADSSSELMWDLMRTIAQEYGWPDYGPVERTLTTLAPTEFDRRVGAYEVPGAPPLVLWREGERFYSRVPGQPVREVFPTSTDEYFLKAANVRLVFPSTSSNVDVYRATMPTSAKRMDEAAGKRLVDESITLARRVREQRAAPGSEATLREMVQGLIDGKPNYARLTPALAFLTRQQLPRMTGDMTKRGALRTIRFVRVEPAGADTYALVFDRGEIPFTLALGTDGRVETARYVPD